jgi:glycosyltransferase involved in cell wall biosynthesis
MTEKVQIKTPLVSVVIPTYNRSKELARAIKSVLNQT